MGIKENILSLFYGRCDIYETVHTADDRGVTGESVELRESDMECRLVFSGRESYSLFKSAGGGAHKNDNVLNVRVFLPPEVNVRAGSILRVRQNGIVYRLKSTTEPVRYRHHIEVGAVPEESEV